MFRSKLHLGALIAAIVASPLFADVTIRYKSEVKLNPALPPALTGQAGKAVGAALSPETVLQLKEGKGRSTQSGLESIIDFARRQITMLDPAGRKYATMSADQFAGEFAKAMPATPPEAREAMAKMKIGFDSRATGRSATIHGIEAEERELVMTIEPPPGPGVPPGPVSKAVFQIWTAKASEALRVPAVREVTGYNLWSFATMNPAASIEKMLQSSGMADSMKKFMDETQMGRTLILRVHAAILMPGLAAALKNLPPEKNPFGATFDPETPLMEMNQELIEISTTPVPDSVFAVPDGYQATTPADIVGAIMTRVNAAMKQ